MRPVRFPVRPPPRKPQPAASRIQQKPTPQPPKPAIVEPVPPQGLLRGLFVGINYIGTQYELAGCINDAVDMQSHVQFLFPMCKETRLITDNTAIKPTKASIMSSIDWLVSGLIPGQNVFLHYSGHGGLVRDTNGDEISGLDSTLYAINNGTIEQITDDEIRAALVARIPTGCKCFVVFDCCHSGSAVDLRCTWQSPSQEVLTYTEDQKYAKTAGQVLFLSGCHDMQVAMDTVNKEGRPCGALTMALLETWKAYGAAIKLKYILWDVRKFLRDYGYQQVPQLTTGAFMDMNAVFDLGSSK